MTIVVVAFAATLAWMSSVCIPVLRASLVLPAVVVVLGAVAPRPVARVGSSAGGM